MKKLAQFWGIALLVCVILGTLSGMALAASSNLPFKDVDKNDWYYDAVQYVYDNQMMSGTDSTSFSPNGTTTRGMLVTILHRLEGTPSVSGTHFKDVADSQWYADAVVWASANGIVFGYDQGLFKPNAAITREQLVVILYRYSQYKGYDCTISGNISGFKDVSQVSSYAMDSMRWAIGKGLISGVGNNTLSPKENATRAQVAATLMHFRNKLILNIDTEEPSGTGPENSNTAQYYVQYRKIVEQREVDWGVGEAVSELQDKSVHDLQGVAIIRLLDMNHDGTDELILGYSKLNFDKYGTTVANSRAEIWSYDGKDVVKLFDEKYPVHASDISVWMTLAHIDGEYLILSGYDGYETDLTYWGIRNGKMSAVHTLSRTFDEDRSICIYKKDGMLVSGDVYQSAYQTWIDSGNNYQFNGIEYRLNGTREDAASIISETAKARQKLGLGT